MTRTRNIAGKRSILALVIIFAVMIAAAPVFADSANKITCSISTIKISCAQETISGNSDSLILVSGSMSPDIDGIGSSLDCKALMVLISQKNKIQGWAYIHDKGTNANGNAILSVDIKKSVYAPPYIVVCKKRDDSLWGFKITENLQVQQGVFIPNSLKQKFGEVGGTGNTWQATVNLQDPVEEDENPFEDPYAAYTSGMDETAQGYFDDCMEKAKASDPLMTPDQEEQAAADCADYARETRAAETETVSDTETTITQADYDAQKASSEAATQQAQQEVLSTQQSSVPTTLRIDTFYSSGNQALPRKTFNTAKINYPIKIISGGKTETITANLPTGQITGSSNFAQISYNIAGSLIAINLNEKVSKISSSSSSAAGTTITIEPVPEPSSPKTPNPPETGTTQPAAVKENAGNTGTLLLYIYEESMMGKPEKQTTRSRLNVIVFGCTENQKTIGTTNGVVSFTGAKIGTNCNVIIKDLSNDLTYTIPQFIFTKDIAKGFKEIYLKPATSLTLKLTFVAREYDAPDSAADLTANWYLQRDGITENFGRTSSKTETSVNLKKNTNYILKIQKSGYENAEFSIKTTESKIEINGVALANPPEIFNLDPQQHTLTVSVKGSNTPIDKATILIGSQRYYTTSAGTIDIPLKSGTYSVKAWASGYIESTQSITLNNDKTLSFDLKPKDSSTESTTSPSPTSQKYHMTVVVYEKVGSSSKPISDANVNLYAAKAVGEYTKRQKINTDKTSPTGTTNNLPDLAPGSYTIVVSKQGYESVTTTFAVSGNDVTKSIYLIRKASEQKSVFFKFRVVDSADTNKNLDDQVTIKGDVSTNKAISPQYFYTQLVSGDSEKTITIALGNYQTTTIKMKVDTSGTIYRNGIKLGGESKTYDIKLTPVKPTTKKATTSSTSTKGRTGHTATQKKTTTKYTIIVKDTYGNSKTQCLSIPESRLTAKTYIIGFASDKQVSANNADNIKITDLKSLVSYSNKYAEAKKSGNIITITIKNTYKLNKGETAIGAGTTVVHLEPATATTANIITNPGDVKSTTDLKNYHPKLSINKNKIVWEWDDVTSRAWIFVMKPKESSFTEVGDVIAIDNPNYDINKFPKGTKFKIYLEEDRSRAKSWYSNIVTYTG